MSMIGCIASGEPRRILSVGWDETNNGETREYAPVSRRCPVRTTGRLNLPNRSVRTRMHGGVGGRSREVSSYPDYWETRMSQMGYKKTVKLTDLRPLQCLLPVLSS